MPREAEVAVVTTYLKEDPAVLRRALQSVARQTVPVHHIIVSDGRPQAWVADHAVEHVVLDKSWNDHGNTPRSIGSRIAIDAGFERICYLDADNWFADDHVETMLEMEDRNADFVVAQRHIVRPDGTLLPYSRPDDGVSFVDTNCMFLRKAALGFCDLWSKIPPPLACIGDRVLTGTMRNHGLESVAAQKKTVFYTCLLTYVYAEVGEEPPADAKPDVDYQGLVDWWTGIGRDARLAYEKSAGFPLSF